MPFDQLVDITQMNYTHLIREELYQIYALKKAGHKQREIAQVLKRSDSTISRELARNCGRRSYRPKWAHSMAIRRRSMNAISPETVYQRVYADKRAGGLLWKNLRCQKQRKKRYGKIDRRGTIPNRLFIEDRPAIVETRSRIGDWETTPSSARTTSKLS
jgi:IS30 family transposase